jgi:alkylation response protein AidB-like acyl-CoA dehydrogenase
LQNHTDLVGYPALKLREGAQNHGDRSMVTMSSKSAQDGSAPDFSSGSDVTVALLNERSAKIVPKLAAGAAERERTRELPYEQVDSIAAAQLFAFRIPKKYGGAGSLVTDVIRFIIEVAAADSNIAQALRPGFALVESLRLSDSEAERERWFRRILSGDFFGNAGWEVGGANGAVTARITKQGDHYKANGNKYYSTGSLYADWISTVALDEADEPISFTVPRNREGVDLVDDFDGMGQRLTASGTTRLRDVTVYPDEIRSRPNRNQRSPVTAFLQLFLGAVEAGIAKNALADAVTFTRDHARPIKHSSAQKSVDDPYVQYSVGEISARAYAAEAVILRAADSIDAAWTGDLRPETLTKAAVEVAQAQFLAAEAALRASELIFDVGGGSTTARKHNLDRHWRNARTVANHNPRHWKAAAVGAYQLNGADLPTSGLF